MSLRDLLLLLVILSSIAVAVLFPDFGRNFQPYLIYMMMVFLFLSFLKIDFQAFLDTSFSSLLSLAKLVAVKLFVIPVVLYAICTVVLPEWAVPVLLLSGISTGVVSPFIAGILGADVPVVLRMVVATSLLVPFSLPCLVKLLVGKEIAIPLEMMVQLLAIVIFVPVVAVYLVRRFAPGILTAITRVQFPVSLVLFAAINFGVFSKYSSFFFQETGKLLASIGLAYLLCGVYYAIGYFLTPGQDPARRLAAAVSMAIMNNVLVVVFASQFFGPLSPTLAAMYMFPFFTMIVPIRLILNRTELISPGKPKEI
ncbi:MAG: bile acid:sodium symporter [Desulfomonile tiedjei]|nr:bile acid:sodium symporter [Desulfomonile tiedjei]